MKATTLWAGKRTYSFEGDAYDLGGAILDEKDKRVTPKYIAAHFHLNKCLEIFALCNNSHYKRDENDKIIPLGDATGTIP